MTMNTTMTTDGDDDDDGDEDDEKLTIILLFRLQLCMLTKQMDNSSLYVKFSAETEFFSCDNCCKRWYVTFNRVECSPVPLEQIDPLWETITDQSDTTVPWKGYADIAGMGNLHRPNY